ncbi:MAG TPA: ABC transporter permease [Chloroflexi bacterium]|nr:ABC transporter permease [Chloroflexota bacterium]HHW84761.1 sugar ABC transporter permease [Chloroflexota bacterium]
MRFGLLFAAPAFVFFGVFYVYPLFRTFYVSLFSWSLLDEPRFIGITNYVNLSNDKEFINSVGVSFYYAIGVCVAIWVIALALALMFNQTFRFRQAYLSVYYLPAVISLTVWSLVWLFMYNPSFGLFSEFARWLGFANVRMLDNPQTAMPAMILLSIWKGTPVYMLIYLAGLRAIPGDYYEAAKVDGASALQRLWHITLPLLRPVFLYVVVISIIGAFQAFTPMYLLTNGGPGSATRVLSMFIFQNGFQFLKMGYASAASVIFLLILLVFSVVQFRILRFQQQD